MLQADRIRLRHMLDSGRTARKLVENRRRDDLDADIGLVLSLMKAIEIIGEAASKLTAEFRERHPELPWAEIIGMRNRLVHVYFDINLELLWKTVIEDLPPLIDELEGLAAGD